MQPEGDDSPLHPAGEHSRITERQGATTSLRFVLLGSDGTDRLIWGKTSIFWKFLQFLNLSWQFPFTSLDLISFFHEVSLQGWDIFLLLSFLYLIWLQVKIYDHWHITTLLVQESYAIKSLKMAKMYASATLFSAPDELCALWDPRYTVQRQSRSVLALR